LSALNPTAAKAAMLYTRRAGTWNVGAEGDVPSSSSWKVVAENLRAATVHAVAIRDHLPPSDPGEPR